MKFILFCLVFISLSISIGNAQVLPQPDLVQCESTCRGKRLIRDWAQLGEDQSIYSKTPVVEIWIRGGGSLESFNQYGAVKLLELILANYPCVRGESVKSLQKWLGKNWIYSASTSDIVNEMDLFFTQDCRR